MNRPFPPLTLLMLSLLQFVAAGYTRLTGHGENIEGLATRGGIRPPEIPAGYAFSIWMVIFALSVGFGLYYAGKGKTNPLMQRLSWPTAVLFALSSAWMFAAQMIGDGWHLVFLIVIMWMAAVRGALTLRFDAAETGSRLRTWGLQPLFGLFAGWLTAAMFLNITGTYAKTVGTFGMTPNGYALLTLIPAGITAAVLVYKLKAEPWLLAAMLWALTAVGIANLENPPLLGVSAALGAVLLLVFTGVRLQKQTKA